MPLPSPCSRPVLFMEILIIIPFHSLRNISKSYDFRISRSDTLQKLQGRDEIFSWGPVKCSGFAPLECVNGRDDFLFRFGDQLISVCSAVSYIHLTGCYMTKNRGELVFRLSKVIVKKTAVYYW